MVAEVEMLLGGTTMALTTMAVKSRVSCKNIVMMAGVADTTR
jgi:hypothetical protein